MKKDLTELHHHPHPRHPLELPGKGKTPNKTELNLESLRLSATPSFSGAAGRKHKLKHKLKPKLKPKLKHKTRCSGGAPVSPPCPPAPAGSCSATCSDCLHSAVNLSGPWRGAGLPRAHRTLSGSLRQLHKGNIHPLKKPGLEGAELGTKGSFSATAARGAPRNPPGTQ